MKIQTKIKQNILPISIGVVYLWFGLLKFFPNLSPAEELAKTTIYELTFGLVPPNISIILLAILETGIGLLLIFNFYKTIAIRFALGHIFLTFTPLFIFPEQVFNNTPFELTLLGQYIAKNLIIVSVLIALLNNNGKHGKFARI
ncbi:putative membrane protein YphA (DoxX/SURF4 family) [Saonia flava]|uniref:Putative membrane protein YphA (DoxX/SURF4 family) n=1 Tax=Saonia flava TaxID=523696 RepID=A0A846QYK7_9FLAO|nr:DoxX family membrane protein [Saonia flava]NJB70715.1 putative membrane protein YphA (DoxX/SURF4 family) [Saonia flava]